MKDIKELLNERDISLEQLAQAVGLTRQTINNILHRGVQPSLLTLKKICQYFNVDWRDYLGEAK